jgi:putative ABC transport system permease protein
MEDYISLRDKSTYIAACSPSFSSGGQFIYGGNNYPASISGVTPEYLSIRKLNIDDGNVFSHQQVAAAKVCLVGKTITKDLFPNGENSIGKVIRFNKIPFTIIGTIKEKVFNTMGMD